MHVVDLVLDSGAFSAWKQREVLSVELYSDFIHKHLPSLWRYVNLDVIPGGFGHKPSHAEVEESARAGWKNLEYMRSRGLNPMPVYHMGERLYWLDRMVDEGFDYIGISPANDRTTEQKQEWLDEIFGHLCGKEGYPKVRTHGFGVTALPLLYRYPWYSADSISWILFGGYGMILIPRNSNGKYDYTQSPYSVYVSDRSSKAEDGEMGPQSVAVTAVYSYDTMGKNQKRYINEYLAKEGFGLDVCRSSYIERLKVNLRFFRKITESYEPQPFICKNANLFNEGVKNTRVGSDTNLFGKMELIFTTTTSREHSELLNIEKIRKRLISWYHLFKGDKMDITDYVATGLMNHVKPRGTPRVRVKTEEPKPRVKLTLPVERVVTPPSRFKFVDI